MRTLSLTLSAAALAIGSAAIAQPGQGGPRGHDAGPVTRAEVQTRSAEHFARMDVDGDGFLTPADREAHRARMIARADTDGDGTLSEAERSAARETRAARHGDQATRHPGRPGGPEGRPGRPGGHDGERMARIDTDGDGRISLAEYQAEGFARFERADTDNDGTVTDEERRAARAAHRAERRQRREQAE